MCISVSRRFLLPLLPANTFFFAQIREGFIVDEDEEEEGDGDDEDADAPRAKRKREPRDREQETQLDEDDYELIGETMGDREEAQPKVSNSVPSYNFGSGVG